MTRYVLGALAFGVYAAAIGLLAVFAVETDSPTVTAVEWLTQALRGALPAITRVLLLLAIVAAVQFTAAGILAIADRFYHRPRGESPRPPGGTP